MNLKIGGHHVAVTPAMEEYVREKLSRVSSHFDPVVEVDVILSVDKVAEKSKRQKALVMFRYKGGDIIAEEANEDLYAAIDLVMDKIDRQVVSRKERTMESKTTRCAALKRIPLGEPA